MFPRRRMILQLTALVDLLFIVMFLQYIELQESSNRRLRSEAERRQLAEAARVDANRLKESALAHTSAMTQRLQDLQTQNQTLQDKLDEVNKKLAVAAVEQQSEERRQAEELKSIGNVVHQMIGIPPDALAGALRQAPDAEREKLLSRLEELKRQPPAKLVQHLRETAELKKYSEIWQAHIYSDNSISINLTGEGAGDRFFPRTADEVANRLVTAAKEHGEPKSLVIVCLTWADADLRTREIVSNGLKFAVIALKPEWGGGKRIEVARLGYAESP